MATGKTHSKFSTVDIDDYANVIRDISASITDISIPRTYDSVDVRGYSDGVINFQLGQPNTPLTMQGVYDTTALTGAHTVLSRLVGVIEDSVLITIQIGIREVPPIGGNPEYEGLFYCQSLVYDGSLNFTAEFVPATSTAPAWATV
jgi:hypothetical protein